MMGVSPSPKDRDLKDEARTRVRLNPNPITIGIKITGGEEVFYSIFGNKMGSGLKPIRHPQILKSPFRDHKSRSQYTGVGVSGVNS